MAATPILSVHSLANSKQLCRCCDRQATRVITSGCRLNTKARLVQDHYCDKHARSLEAQLQKVRHKAVASTKPTPSVTPAVTP